MSFLERFAEVWCVDFEFRAPEGARPNPICMVARELRTGRAISLWGSELLGTRDCPFDISPRSLFVAYYASAEIGCFLALGWNLPANVLDLYAEFRCLTNGLATPSGRGLVGALTWYGLDVMASAEKDANRDLAIRGGPYTGQERRRLLDYCAADVDALIRLLNVMLERLSLHALLRGRYMRAAASMEWNGIPIDVATLTSLRDNWDTIQGHLIAKVDGVYHVYDGRRFKQDRFARWLHDHAIQWPILDSGRLALDDDTFRTMARAYPQVAPLQELRVTMGQMRLLNLSVGVDGRNRCLLSAFASRSSRNQPSNTRFAFGTATWLRGLISPESGCALAYVDYSQQEFGIAAALSGDAAMQGAYRSGDPYLGFAKSAGAVPPDATKHSHPTQREVFKTVTLGVQYSMSEFGLARRLGICLTEARHMLELHRQAFSKFWHWSDAAVDYAMLWGEIHSVFGWTLHVTPDTKPRSLRNFPMQANGAEILRMACCLATERGINVCAPVHDALLVGGATTDIEDVVEMTQACMREAGEIVLNGFALTSEAKIIRHPERSMDPRGQQMWDTVMSILEDHDPLLCRGGSPGKVATPA